MQSMNLVVCASGKNLQDKPYCVSGSPSNMRYHNHSHFMDPSCLLVPLAPLPLALQSLPLWSDR